MKPRSSSKSTTQLSTTSSRSGRSRVAASEKSRVPQHSSSSSIPSPTIDTTIFGRKTVLHALQHPSITVKQLFIGEVPGLQEAGKQVVGEIKRLAEQRGVPITNTSRQIVASISKHKEMDQAVAAYVETPKSYETVSDILSTAKRRKKMALLAMDGVSSYSNTGLILRSVVASGAMDGVIITGSQQLDIRIRMPGTNFNSADPINVYHPLVSFASCGVSLSQRYFMVKTEEDWNKLKDYGFEVNLLTSNANSKTTNLFRYKPKDKVIYVMGGETSGASQLMTDLADRRLRIPMATNVDSLNVTGAASVVCYYHLWSKSKR